MATSGPSQADRDLAALASTRGAEVTPRQVERYREAGVQQPPDRHGLGQGRGSVAVYGPGAVEQVVDIVQQLDRHRRLNEAALVVFLHGHPVKERALRRAYAGVYKDLRAQLNPDQLDDPWDVASKASKLLGRYASRSATAKEWKRRLKESNNPEALGRVMHDVIWFMFGGAEEGETLSSDVFEAVGMSELVENMPPEDQEQLHALIRALSLSNLETKAAEASYEDLVLARDSLHAVMQLLFGEAEPAPNTEWAFAVVGIPAVLVVGTVMGSALASLVATLREAARQT